MPIMRGNYDVLLIQNKKKIMRCDALFHLMKTKAFTKQNIIRIVYQDDKNGDEVYTNALRLKFGTVRSDNETKSEIVYIRLDNAGHHILNRSNSIANRSCSS